jgi:hypothetical protein
MAGCLLDAGVHVNQRAGPDNSMTRRIAGRHLSAQDFLQAPIRVTGAARW